jgi:hypothetical protein
MQFRTSVSNACIRLWYGLPARRASRYPRKRSKTVTAQMVRRPNSRRYALARAVTAGLARLNPDRVSVSSSAASTRTATPGRLLPDELLPQDLPTPMMPIHFEGTTISPPMRRM